MEVRARVSGVFPLSLLEMRVKCTATYRPGETREDPGSSLCGYDVYAVSLCVDDHQDSLHGVHPGWKRVSETIQGKEHGDQDHVSPSEVKGDLGCVQGKCVV